MRDEAARPTEDPGHIRVCPVCGRSRQEQTFPGCYWGKFSQSWTCRSDNPYLGEGRVSYVYPQPPWPEPPASTPVSWRAWIGEQSYTYVAVRILGSGWYLTGQITWPMSWAELCYWLPPEDGRFLVLGVTGQITAVPQ